MFISVFKMTDSSTVYILMAIRTENIRVFGVTLHTNKIKLQFVCNCFPILHDKVVQGMTDESTYTVEIRIVTSKQGQERPSMGTTTRAIQSDCTVIFYTAPAHRAIIVRNSSTKCTDTKRIGCASRHLSAPLYWPPQSRDLSFCDICHTNSGAHTDIREYLGSITGRSAHMYSTTTNYNHTTFKGGT